MSSTAHFGVGGDQANEQSAEWRFGSLFCSCGGLRLHTDTGLMRCQGCGKESSELDETGLVLTAEQQHEKRRVIGDGEVAVAGPTTSARCPDCGHEKAQITLQNTRAADESETRLFTCTSCGYRWREED